MVRRKRLACIKGCGERKDELDILRMTLWGPPPLPCIIRLHATYWNLVFVFPGRNGGREQYLYACKEVLCSALEYFRDSKCDVAARHQPFMLRSFCPVFSSGLLEASKGQPASEGRAAHDSNAKAPESELDLDETSDWEGDAIDGAEVCRPVLVLSQH